MRVPPALIDTGTAGISAVDSQSGGIRARESNRFCRLIQLSKPRENIAIDLCGILDRLTRILLGYLIGGLGITGFHRIRCKSGGGIGKGFYLSIVPGRQCDQIFELVGLGGVTPSSPRML